MTSTVCMAHVEEQRTFNPDRDGGSRERQSAHDPAVRYCSTLIGILTCPSRHGRGDPGQRLTSFSLTVHGSRNLSGFRSCMGDHRASRKRNRRSGEARAFSGSFTTVRMVRVAGNPLTARCETLTTLDLFGLITWDGNEPMLRMLQVDSCAKHAASDGYILQRGSRRDQIKNDRQRRVSAGHVSRP